MASMMDHALAYAGRGLAVFPCWTVLPTDTGFICACGRASCENRGKHPLGSVVRNGLSDASTDNEKVKHWWTLKPDANIGLATGKVIVLDVDPRHGGDQSLVELEGRHGPLPKTRRARTGGGGEHIYFRPPAGVTINNSAGKLAPGLDVRGSGGYVLASPSLHESGNRYEWLDNVPSVEMPAWLTGLINKAGGGNGSGKGKTPAQWHETIANTIHNGTRDNTLTSIAGKLLHIGVDVLLMHDLLGCVNIARCDPPLPDADIKRIVQSAVRMHVNNQNNGGVK